MAALKTARVRMLGNYKEYENGKEYDVTINEGNMLTGIGFACVVETVKEPAKVEGDENGL
jgi:hypothetical protein